MTDLGQIIRIRNFFGLGVPSKMHSPTVKIGLIGASQVSTYAVIWPSHRLLSCSVVAVAARDADRAAKFAKWHRIPRSYGSYDDLLADPEIDAVYIGLPNGLHGHWAKRSLAAGKHVLVEKPFASNEKEAKEVMLLSRRKGLLCREAFHYQEHPLNQRLIQLMRPDLSPLGRIQRIDTKLLIPRWAFGTGNIRYEETLAGGAMMDAGAYVAHISRSLASAAGYGPLKVASAAAKTLKGSDTIDGAMIVNWTAETTKMGGLQGLWHSCIQSWNRTVNPDQSRVPSKSAKVASEHKQLLRGQMHVSLQSDKWFPVSDVKVTGTRGSLLCKGFVVPFFGHVIKLDLHSEVSKGGLDTSSKIEERVYGSGESTYFYQLQRFIADVEASCMNQHEDTSFTGSSMESLAASMRRDISDATSNMRFLDQSYLAAGLQPRKPTECKTIGS